MHGLTYEVLDGRLKKNKALFLQQVMGTQNPTYVRHRRKEYLQH